MLLSSSSTLRGHPCVSSDIGIAMTFNKRNILAYDIGHTDTNRRSEVETELDRTFLTVVGGDNFALDRDCGCG
jgi:hypothetical protein